MTVQAKVPLSLEEKQYKHKLGQAADPALGQKWQNYWPDHPGKSGPIGYHSDHGFFGSLEDLIQYADIDRQAKPVVCIVQNITMPWTIQLGSAWGLDVRFFIEHVRQLDDKEIHRSLREGRMPNSDGGLRSSHGAPMWSTIRGFVDFSTAKEGSETVDPTVDTTKRAAGQSMFGNYLSHTNMSFYKVNAFMCKCGTDKAQ